MELTLRQITDSLANQQNSQQQANLVVAKSQPKKDLNIKFPLKKIVSISHTHLDFGSCIPGMIYQKIISINLKEDLSEPLGFSIKILCSDSKLNDLPEFVFAVKKDKEFQFVDFLRFRVSRKGCYDFVIGVKTPNFPAYHVKSQLLVYTEFSDLTNPKDCYIVHLEQKICMPVIECTRELQIIKPISAGKFMAPTRVLKFSQIKTKLKKEVRIPFKLDTDTKLTVTNELLGVVQQRADFEKNLLQVMPKQLALMGKGNFIVSFKFGFPEEMTKYLEDLKKSRPESQIVSYTLRRILVMRVHMTNIHFHFPVEVNFFLGDKKSAIQTD